MAQIDFLAALHTKAKRNYVQRAVEYDKAECAQVAKHWGYDYWDGERRFGYGGYFYDGRWRAVAETMAEYYGIKSGDRILDVGCGKGFLLYEFTQVVPGIEVAGIDISLYGIEHAKDEIRPYLKLGNCQNLPWPNASFDFVYSLNVFHNLKNYELDKALSEVERVGIKKKYVCAESYRNEKEKVNLIYWQLTCETFFDPEEWGWAFQQAGYSGDYGFIYFE